MIGARGNMRRNSFCFFFKHEANVFRRQGDQISPNGGLFALGSFLKIAEVGHSFLGGYFFPRLRVRINFDKNAFGYILGDFFRKLIWSLCQKQTETESWQNLAQRCDQQKLGGCRQRAKKIRTKFLILRNFFIQF
jgi:hypothetical protein